MKATLALYVSFVALSLMLWSGCLGRRTSTAGRLLAPTNVTLVPDLMGESRAAGTAERLQILPVIEASTEAPGP